MAISKTYDLYHIGTKLNKIVNLDTLKEKLIIVLKDRGYYIKEKTESLTLEPIILSSTISIIALKGRVKVQINYLANALNVISESPENTFEIFEELISIVQELDYDTNSIINFYEILCEIIVKTKKPTQEIMNKILKVKSSIIEELGHEINNKGLKLGYESQDKKELFDLLLEPNPLNPKESLHIKIVFRTFDRDKLKNFHNEIEKVIEDVLKFVEE